MESGRILMRAFRALALLATAGVMLVATATAATAAPAPAPPPAKPGGPQSYPPPPPSLATNRASVKVGQSAHLSGNHFAYMESVTLRVTYSAGGGTTIVVRTDRFGRFGSNVKLQKAGTATITATGNRSHFTASVTITVRSKKPRSGPPNPQAPHSLDAFNPLVAINGPDGLRSANQGNAANGNADLMANSDDLTPGSGGFPLGAVGGAVAVIAGILLTLLAFRRRRPESE
jgi:hypothetical protein